VERQRTRLSRFALTRIPRWNPCQGCLLVVNGPTIRPFSAMRAAKEDRARRASHAKFMASREVAVQPVPHVSLCSEVRDLFYRKAGAARGDDAANTGSCIFTNKMRRNSRRGSCAGAWDLLSHDQIWNLRLRLSYRLVWEKLISVGRRSFDRKNTWTHGPRSQHRRSQVLGGFRTIGSRLESAGARGHRRERRHEPARHRVDRRDTKHGRRSRRWKTPAPAQGSILLAPAAAAGRLSRLYDANQFSQSTYQAGRETARRRSAKLKGLTR